VFDSIDQVAAQLSTTGYIADSQLATTLFLAERLGKPVLLEGQPGVGKTEVAKAIAEVFDTELIRLQCYEGLDTHTALYEWNYPRQMLEIRLQEAKHVCPDDLGSNIFSSEFLLKRPLLKALQHHGERAPVLLIDEVDRADEEFEAFLLEVLSDFQISIPELGTISAEKVPFVVLTSNRTRELHDALKRRCLYHWIDYPTIDKERAIINSRVPGIGERLGLQICAFMQLLREENFYKHPGVAETIDWARALLALGITDLDAGVAAETMSCILKYQRDQEMLTEERIAKAVAISKNFKAVSVG
jgi:MoxR-like ATPase